MAKIGLVLRPGVPKAENLAREILELGKRDGHAVLADEATAKTLSLSTGMPCEQLTLEADPIITLGGDGTLIGVARHVTTRSPVMLGVNFGHLGFLTEVRPAELFTVLQRVLDDDAEVGERVMLSAQVVREGKQIFSCAGVNDAVIQKGTRDHLLGLDFFVNDEEVMRLRADGLIVATPTGSTAYSLAAGGSIAHPQLPAFLVTPICPHSLTNRPLILPFDFGIQVRIPPYSGEVFLSVDGQESCALEPGDVVSFSKDPHVVRFVRSQSQSYFDILRTKLNWGIANPVD